MKTIYIAGKITGDPDYRQKFTAVAAELTESGFAVVNPATLPEGLTYAAYIRITTAMLDECDAVMFLPDWKDSKGVRHEMSRAETLGLDILYYAIYSIGRNMAQQVQNDVKFAIDNYTRIYGNRNNNKVKITIQRGRAKTNGFWK